MQSYQVSLAWLLSARRVASAIVGAETVEEVTANATSADVTLDQAQLDALTALQRARRAERDSTMPRRRRRGTVSRRPSNAPPPFPLAERLASDQEVLPARLRSASAVATTAFASSRSLDRVEISRRASASGSRMIDQPRRSCSSSGSWLSGSSSEFQ